MRVFQDISTIREAIKAIKQEGKTIGLTPTMGALHPGHTSLIAASLPENDITIASIFVNPIQFNNPQDLEAYPTSLTDDLTKLEKAGCDIVFIPDSQEMYQEPPLTKFNFGNLETTMEGAYRPGHFSGVALVVMKLFNIIQPTRAYFGQKDLQQYKIIEQMVVDTSQEVKLVMMPIIREDSGLALSSRNRRLKAEDLLVASQIYQALKAALMAYKNSNSLKKAIQAANNQLQLFPTIKIEYLHFVTLKDLQIVEAVNAEDQLALCFAGYIGEIRLIDNIILPCHE